MRMSRSLARISILAGVAAVYPTLGQTPLAGEPKPKSVRIGMEELHAAGGVPPGWEMSFVDGSAEAGRRIFVEVGCRNCHVVRGAGIPELPEHMRGVGPELTGMGEHHPPAYFAESILNPNAVLLEGPGYVGEDGYSKMPAYPSLTVGELIDVVAFLRSLRGDESSHGFMTELTLAPSEVPANIPASPSRQASAFLAQRYDVREDQLDAFISWFQKEGASSLLGRGGLVSIETFVDHTERRPSLLTVFGFEDQQSLGRFSTNGAVRAAKMRFDEFVGQHGHSPHSSPPLYRVEELSAQIPGSSECAAVCKTCHAESLATCRSRYHRMIEDSVLSR